MSISRGPELPESDAPPYRPPPIAGPSGERTPLRLRAVVSGVAVDWVATWIVSYLILFLALIVAGARYETTEEVESYLENLVAAPDFVALTSLIGLLCVTLGGFVAVAIARSGALRHGLVVGLCSLVLSLVLDGLDGREAAGWYPMWFRVLGLCARGSDGPAGRLAGRAHGARVEAVLTRSYAEGSCFWN